MDNLGGVLMKVNNIKFIERLKAFRRKSKKEKEEKEQFMQRMSTNYSITKGRRK